MLTHIVFSSCCAALVRSEFGRAQLAERQALLGAQASRLKQLAEAFRIPVVVTNQVAGVRQDGGPRRGAFGYAPPDAPQQPAPEAPTTAAALGTKWAHDVNTRLSLEVSPATGERIITVRRRLRTTRHMACTLG